MKTGYLIDCKTIRKKRICAGLTQSKLCKDINISTATLCNLESGKTIPNPDILKRICDELSLNMEDIVTVK